MNIILQANTYREKLIRQEANLSLTELSTKSGVLENELRFYESGFGLPPLENGIKIAQALNVNLSFLYGVNDIQVSFSNKGKKNNYKELIQQYTYEQVANYATTLGISQNLYAHLKLLEEVPSINIAYKLCILFNVSLDYILNLTDIKNWRDVVVSQKKFTEQEYFEYIVLKNTEVKLSKVNVFRMRNLIQDSKLKYGVIAKEIDEPVSKIYSLMAQNTLPKLNFCLKLAKYFNVSLEYLLNISEIKASNEIYSPSLKFLTMIEDYPGGKSQFAKDSDLSYQIVYDLSKKSHNTMRSYIKIATTLGCSVDYIIGLTSYRNWEIWSQKHK